MTTVYNVTYYGGREQIRSKLAGIPGLPEEKLLELSSYLATQTFQSIRELFSAAQKIQDWLSQSAYLIALVRQRTVKWESPMGLSIAQPYFLKEERGKIVKK